MNEPSAGSAVAGTPPLGPLVLISAAGLGLEVLLTRLLSYSLSANLVYVVLGIALLGFGAGGTLVSLRPAWRSADRLRQSLAWAYLAFPLSIVIGYALFVRLTPFLQGFTLSTLLAASLLTAPFLAAGTVIALSLSTARRVGRMYAANLVGSGLGCVLPVVLLGPLTGPGALAALAALGLAAGACAVAQAPGRALKVAALGVFLAVAGCLMVPDRLFALSPEPAPFGQLSTIREFTRSAGIEERRVYDAWNATGRIEIFSYRGVGGSRDPYPFLFYAQDSSAGSALARWNGRHDPADNNLPLPRACLRSLWGQAYYEPRHTVLVIGLGGGMDVQCALYHGATAVDVAEINPSTVTAVRGSFDDWLGGIGSSSRVRYFVQDGRSFVHEAAGSGRYDVIQLSGVDTKQNLVSGSLAVAENTLYTREAFRDYLSSLSDDGVLSIVRFGDQESLRLAHTAVTALRDLGAPHPEQHLVIYESAIARGVMVRRTPFSERELDALEAYLSPDDPRPGARIFFYELFGLQLYRPPAPGYVPFVTDGDYAEYFAAVREGREVKAVEEAPLDVSAPTDDKPFFFDVFRYDSAEALTYPHVQAIGGILLSVLLLSVSLILLPASRFRRSEGASSQPRAALFFACVGFAYLFVEVWLIHRFAMYLGHQTYSLVVVLFALLLSTGAGAWLAERWVPEPSRRIRWGTVAIGLWLGAGYVSLDSVLDATWSLPLPGRAALTLAYVLPLAFFMGFPYPAGLGWAKREAEPKIPWFVAINGFSSVVATLVVIPLSMAFGYTAILAAAGLLYAGALLAARALGLQAPDGPGTAALPP